MADDLEAALTAPGGLSQRRALAALKRLPTASAASDADILPAADGDVLVREATAVASGSIRDNGRRVVVVVDIGGGTSDFGRVCQGAGMAQCDR